MTSFLVVDCPRYYTDLEYRLQQHIRANDLLQHEIGYRPYAEQELVYMKGALEVRLGAHRELSPDRTAWIHPAIQTADQLPALLKQTEALDLQHNPVPELWREKAAAFHARTGRNVTFRPSMTGPVTLAGNILGQTALCLWVLEEPGDSPGTHP